LCHYIYKQDVTAKYVVCYIITVVYGVGTHSIHGCAISQETMFYVKYFTCESRTKENIYYVPIHYII